MEMKIRNDEKMKNGLMFARTKSCDIAKGYTKIPRCVEATVGMRIKP